MSTIADLNHRLNVLIEMREAVETSTTICECDGCHRHVPAVTDFDTEDAGEYMYCKVCVSKRLSRVEQLIRNARKAIKS